MKRIWKFLSSLQLTVWCLAAAVVLVFLGTLAQANEGLYNAQERWFRSAFIWWDPGILSLKIPVFPGGYLIGFTLVVNLIAAHIKRFAWGWNKLGIHLTHAGITAILLGGLMTDLFSKETMLAFREGEKKSFTEDARLHELAVAMDAGNGQDKVVVFPEAQVERSSTLAHPDFPFTLKLQQYHVNSSWFVADELLEAATRLKNAMAALDGQFSSAEALPGAAERALNAEGRLQVWQSALRAIGEQDNDILAAARRVAGDAPRAARLMAELKQGFRSQMLNAFIMQARRPDGDANLRFVAERYLAGKPINGPEDIPPRATQGVGPRIAAFPEPEVKDMKTKNMPMAIVEVEEGGKSLGTWFLNPLIKAQTISVAGRSYQLSLRSERTYHPFSLTLLKTTHEVYQGTEIPKNYQSRVKIENPVRSETREVDIYMNNPLRYEGLAFFQSQMGRDEVAGMVKGTSTLQVVRNPSWLIPYIGCIVVSIGLVFQFGYHLVRFIGKRRRAEVPVTKRPLKKVPPSGAATVAP